MPLLVNLRHLEADDQTLEGELTAEELDLDPLDEAIRLTGPLRYRLEVQRMESGLLVRGSLRLPLECECVRCLKVFACKLDLSDWNLHLALEGEEAAPVSSDCVDLTPYIREDTLLEFPQHPLCDTECQGLQEINPSQAKSSTSIGQPERGSPAWDELNKLKF
jgi:uncharacterized protein